MIQEDKSYLLKKEEKLFEATLNEFSTKNFELASTNEIIKKANYNKGSFYYRFKTKEELYFALIDYVYTVQISLFNAHSERMSDLNTPQGIIDSIWHNLREVYAADIRYYNFISKIELERSELRQEISNNCIESLFDRSVRRLRQVIDNLDIDMDMIIKSYKHFYIDFPFNTDEIADVLLTRYILGLKKNAYINNKENKSFLLTDLPTNPSYIITNAFPVDSSTDNIFVSNILKESRSFIDNVHQTMKIRKIDLKNIIMSGISRNLRDYSYLEKMINLPFSNKSFHLLDLSEQTILIMVYLTLIGTEKIILDITNIFRLTSQIKLVFDELLPMMAKTSKIIVLDSEIFISESNVNNIYRISSENDIVKINPDILYELPFESYTVSYFNDSGQQVLKRIKKDKFNFDDYKSKTMLTIKESRKLNRRDVEYME